MSNMVQATMSNMVHFLSTFENVTFDEKKHIELMGETLNFDVLTLRLRHLGVCKNATLVPFLRMFQLYG